MPRSIEQVLLLVITVALVMLSAIVHEAAHGWVALRCGDPTAKEAGRLTLDPRAHLDGFGSVLLPVLMALLGGPVFGFARPVPYNPRRLRNPRRDELLVALAGPASNVLQALLGTLALGLVSSSFGGPSDWVPVPPTWLWWVFEVLLTYVYVNLTLCFFNLVPFPPLDGSKLVLYFLTGEARRRFYELQRWFMAALILVLYILPDLIGVDLIGLYLDATAGALFDLIVAAVI